MFHARASRTWCLSIVKPCGLSLNNMQVYWRHSSPSLLPHLLRPKMSAGDFDLVTVELCVFADDFGPVLHLPFMWMTSPSVPTVYPVSVIFVFFSSGHENRVSLTVPERHFMMQSEFGWSWIALAFDSGQQRRISEYFPSISSTRFRVYLNVQIQIEHRMIQVPVWIPSRELLPVVIFVVLQILNHDFWRSIFRDEHVDSRDKVFHRAGLKLYFAKRSSEWSSYHRHVNWKSHL